MDYNVNIYETLSAEDLARVSCASYYDACNFLTF